MNTCLNPAASYDYGLLRGALGFELPLDVPDPLDEETALLGFCAGADTRNDFFNSADLEDDGRECARCTCALPRANAECPMCGYQP
jgi:hypothetical protein